MTARRKTKIIAILFILLCLLGAGGALLYSVFRVGSVFVEGNEKVSKERIVALSGILLDESVFKVNLYDVEANIRQNPYIDVLSVKRKLPDGIEIAVRERTPLAAVLFGSYMVIIDEMGVVLEIASVGASGLIEVHGIDLMGYKVAEPITTEDDFQGTSLVALFLALKQSDMLDLVESIDMENPLNMSFTMHNGLLIRVGQPDQLLDKLAWAKAAVPNLEERNLTDGELDVTSGVDAWYRQPRQPEAPEEGMGDESGAGEDEQLSVFPGEAPPGEAPPGETPSGETPLGETPLGETPPGE